MKKECPVCKEIKEESEFYKRNREGKNLSGYCKKCNNDNAKNRQREFKKDCVKYKGGMCQKCGYDKCLGALEFHHKDPSKKKFGLAQIKTTSFEKNKKMITEELDKCDLLCRNCHAEEHWG